MGNRLVDYVCSYLMFIKTIAYEFFIALFLIFLIVMSIIYFNYVF